MEGIGKKGIGMEKRSDVTEGEGRVSGKEKRIGKRLELRGEKKRGRSGCVREKRDKILPGSA